jgi:dTDP-4-dehydrorhamnose reductase
VRVDEAENDESACRAANAAGAVAVARACAREGLPSLSFSTDLVFDGATQSPYAEEASPRPLNAYGRSKLEMEEKLAGIAGRHLIVRTAAFFSPHDSYNFASQCADAADRKQAFVAVADCTISPTYVPDLCRAALDLLIDRETGIWHLTNGEAVTWHAFAERLLDALGADDATLVPTRAKDADWRAPRPAYSALTSARGQLMPALDSAISRFAEALGNSPKIPN